MVWGIKKLELALALDNTGSMSSANKMTELKKASHTLLDTLKKAAGKPGDVKVAIIPFDTTVNIGTTYKDEPWFDVSCSALGSPKKCNANTWKDYWEGCVRDRTYPNDTNDAAPTTADTKFPIYDCGSLVKILPLTTDWTALNAKIDEMTPNGNTNVTIGLAWGWHALTMTAPLSEAVAPAPDIDKVLIILTDGNNTKSWKNSNNTIVTRASAIDMRTALACTNIKAANIKIYAVRVIDGNAVAAEELRQQSQHVFRRARARASSMPCSPRSPRTSPICASRSEPGESGPDHHPNLRPCDQHISPGPRPDSAQHLIGDASDLIASSSRKRLADSVVCSSSTRLMLADSRRRRGCGKSTSDSQ